MDTGMEMDSEILQRALAVYKWEGTLTMIEIHRLAFYCLCFTHFTSLFPGYSVYGSLRADNVHIHDVITSRVERIKRVSPQT